MKNTKIILSLFAAIFCATPFAGAHAKEPVHKLRFLVAHKPANSEHVRLIQNFANRVKEKSGGDVQIKLEFSKYGVDRTLASALNWVYSGEVEMSQIPVDGFLRVSQELDVLDMPMMFRDHEHARKVLDGDIGQRLMETVSAGSNGRVKGLAFTYSGGWRHIYSLEKIDSVSQLKGMKMRMRNGRMGQDAMDLLGLEFFHNQDWPMFQKMHMTGAVQAEEAETNRMMDYKAADPALMKKIKTVLETKHSLYLTMITMNGPALAKLPKKYQKIVENEAQALATQERELSIAQESNGKKMLEKEGIKFVPLSEKDRETIVKMSEKLYKKYHDSLGRWIDEIKDVDSSTLAHED